MNLNELIGKRILVLKGKDNMYYRGESTVVELKICEMSPSEKWVKVMDMNGAKYWKAATEIQPIEVLHHIEYPKP